MAAYASDRATPAWREGADGATKSSLGQSPMGCSPYHPVQFSRPAAAAQVIPADDRGNTVVIKASEKKGRPRQN